MDIVVNKYNTQITEELLSTIDSRSKGEFMECLDKIVLIQNLISPKRRRAKDMSKDKLGRIIVDLENPHVLENMDYFRPAALYYQKHGVYTHLYPNNNPNSDYRKFWDEERRRCIDGYVREDGEWVSGYYYHYLNYTRIQVVRRIDNTRAERVEDFPDVWDGDYWFFHYVEQAEADGKHGNVLKCRGRGYSYKGGSMADRNYHHIKRSKTYLFASETEYLIRDGIMSKAIDSINYLDDSTPFTQPREYKDTEMYKKASYKDIELRTEKGFMSEVFAVTCKDDPNKGRGKRGKLLFFDESGSFPGLETVWGIARKSVEQGKWVYGFMLAAGTGGTMGADFEAALKFFYSPRGYGIKPLRNVYDKLNGVGECSFFVPEYLNRSGCYDKDGNSDVIKALIEIMHQREIVRKGTTDPNALVQEKAESPITPQEAVMRREGSIFPILDLKEYLSDIMPNIVHFTKVHNIGNLIITPSSGIEFRPDPTLVPIRDYPLKDNTDKTGALEIFEMPIRDKEGNTARFRYIGGADVVDDDSGVSTDSLPSIFIFDRLTDRIVAEYTGRPRTANEFFEVCRRLLLFYGATCNYENNKKGMFSYFDRYNCLHLLCDTPQILKDMDYAKGALIGNRAKGTNASTPVNAWGRRLQADWQISSAYGEEESGKLNLHKIRSIGYINECICWNSDGNFDRVSAMNMVMIYREDLAKFEVRKVQEKVKTLADSDYFNRMYKPIHNDQDKYFSYSKQKYFPTTN